MPYYGLPIINEPFKRKFFGERELHHYLAADREEGTLFFWFEAKLLGKAICYPCVIRGDDIIQFKKDDPANNKYLSEEWDKYIDAEKVKDFALIKPQKDELKEIYVLLEDPTSDVMPLYEKLGIEI